MADSNFLAALRGMHGCDVAITIENPDDPGMAMTHRGRLARRSYDRIYVDNKRIPIKDISKVSIQNMEFRK